MTGELTVTRVLHASPDLVWSALLDPVQLACFWGPPGLRAPVERIVVDPRPGGAFEIVMVADADGQEFPTRAVYVELVEPERLVWRDPETRMTTTTTLTPLAGGRTELRIDQVAIPDGLRPELLRGGLDASLDRLVTHLAAS